MGRAAESEGVRMRKGDGAKEEERGEEGTIICTGGKREDRRHRAREAVR
jgi:hypothetical protein